MEHEAIKDVQDENLAGEADREEDENEAQNR